MIMNSSGRCYRVGSSECNPRLVRPVERLEMQKASISRADL